MTRLWTIIGVRDVAGSFAWYQRLFGQPATAPAHDYFGQICDADGTVLLCLHSWGEHDHPSLASPDTPGNGLLLFFRVDVSMRRCNARVRWSSVSKRSRVATRIPAPWNSRSAIPIATT